MIRTRRGPGALLAAVLAAIALAAASPALAEERPAPGQEDPGLRQRIEPDQRVVAGRKELDAGHVDIGPRYADGSWKLMAHDDSDVKASVWRSLDETVLRVRDASLQDVPDDPAYQFLGVPAGAKVHVVPQTQQPGVVWVGWNTQEPGVLAAIDRGATLTLEGVQGPGDLLVYLQSGAFGEPDLLWDSRIAKPQDLYVDINTHTHANWVFTEPGVYLVRVTASADLVDQSEVADTQVIRVVVGDDVATGDAYSATFAAGEPAQDSSQEEPAADAGADGVQLWPLALAGAAVLLLAVAALTAVRSRRARTASREAQER